MNWLVVYCMSGIVCLAFALYVHFMKGGGDNAVHKMNNEWNETYGEHVDERQLLMDVVFIGLVVILWPITIIALLVMLYRNHTLMDLLMRRIANDRQAQKIEQEDWVNEIEVEIEGHSYIIQYDDFVDEKDINVVWIIGCTHEGYEVDVDPIPIHWWPILKNAIIDAEKEE